MPNENSLKNLRSWKKGESGNKKGKPKGSRNVSTYLKKFLSAKSPSSITDDEEIKNFTTSKKITNAEAIALKLLHQAAVKGDLDAIKMIQDRIEGRPGQFIDITTDGEQITGFTFEVVQGVAVDTADEKDNESKSESDEDNE